MKYSIYKHKFKTSNELDTPYTEIQRRDVNDVEWAPIRTPLNANVKCILGSTSCNLRPLRITSIIAHAKFYSFDPSMLDLPLQDNYLNCRV